MAVKNYAPELIQTFITASRQEVRITLSCKKDAQRLRFRYHNLRRDMAKEKHPLSSIAQRVQFKLEEVSPKGPCLLRCVPADDDFLENLKAAGIHVEGDLTPTGVTPEQDPETVANAVEEFMKKE